MTAAGHRTCNEPRRRDQEKGTKEDRRGEEGRKHERVNVDRIVPVVAPVRHHRHR